MRLRKRWTCSLIILALIVTWLPALSISAAAETSGTCGENLTWNYSNGVLTISGTGAMSDYDDYYLSHIPPWKAEYCNAIEKIVIEDGVTSIGNDAFSSCNITKITIPKSVTSIGNDAFSGSSITKIIIPNSVTYIGSSAFSGCGSLSEISLPNSITSIEDGTFFFCESLTNIEIPHSVSSIGEKAFARCASLNKVTLPNSIRTIGDYAFYMCEELTDILIPYGVTTLGDGCFQWCYSLSKMNLPNSVREIGEQAFTECHSLSEVSLPKGITEIKNHTFYDCDGLKSVVIPNGVTDVGNYAFQYCEALRNVTIPGSANSIGVEAFDMCEGLTSITIPDGVKSIGARAFQNCTNLKNVIISHSVTSIGESAFDFCNGPDFYYSGSEEQWDALNVSIIYTYPKVYYYSFGPTNWDEEKTETKQVETDVSLRFSKDISCDNTGSITVLLAEIESSKKELIEKYIKNTLRFTKDEIRVYTPGESYGDCILDRDDCIIRYQENEGKTVAQIYAVCDVNVDSSHNYEFWEDEWVGHVVIYGPQSVKDDSLDYYNYVSMENTDPTLSKLEKATAEVFSEYENFLNAVRSVAQGEGEKASPPIDLSKKLENAGAIFTDTGMPEELYTYVYQTIADDLIEIASAKMTEVSYTSNKTKYATNLVNAVAKDYLHINKTGKFKNNKIQVDANIQGIYGAYYGQVRLLDATSSPSNEYQIAITMNDQHINAVLTNYIQSLDNLAESVTDAVYFAMANDLLGTTIGNFTADKITEFAKKHSQLLTKLKLNGFKDYCLEMYDLYQRIPRYQSTIKTADAATMVKNLDTYLNSTNSYLSEIKNTPAKKAGNKVEKKLKELLALWRKYEKGEDITKESFWKTIFGCPVKVTVYDANGTEIGYSGTDDMWYDDTIEIVEEGDAKIIYSPIGKELNFKVEAYDYGNLSCSVEEVENGAASGRKNYYLSLTEDTEVNLKLPDNSIFSGNGEIEVKANDQEIGLEKTLTSDYYQPFRIVLKTEDVNAGIVYGAGDYIEGDAVHIMAMPQEGYIFNGWYENGDLVSMEDNLEFTAGKGINYTARFLNLDELRPSKQENVLIGDVDGNGGVDAKDITALARHLAKIEIISDEKLLNNADTTQNGNISAEDLTQLAKYVAKIIPSL